MFFSTSFAQEDLLRDMGEIVSQATNDGQVARDRIADQFTEDNCEVLQSSTGTTESDAKHLRESLLKNQIDFNFQFLVKETETSDSSPQQISIPKINLRDEITFLSKKQSKPRSYYLELDKSELLTLIEENYLSVAEKTRKQLLKNAYLVYEVSKLKSEEQIISKIKEELSGEEFSTKVSFLVNLLSYIPKYSVDHLDKKELNSAQVMGQVLNSISDVVKLSYSGVNGINQLAVKIAKELGLENAFGVEFSSNLTGRKQILNLTNPQNPNERFQIEYALPRYHKSQLVTTIDDSLFGGVSIIVIDGQKRESSFIKDSPTSFLSRGAKSTSQGKSTPQEISIFTPQGSSNLFFNENPSGNTIKTSGGRFGLKLNFEDVFYTEIGMAGFSTMRPNGLEGAVDQSVSSRIASGFNFNIIQGDKVFISSYGDASYSASMSCSEADRTICEAPLDKAVSSNAGLKFILGGNTLKNRLTLGTGFYINADDLVNSEGLSLINPVHKISSDTDFRIISNLTGTIGLGLSRQENGDVANWGYSGKVGLSSPTNGTYFEVRADGRLSTDTAFWYPADGNQGSVVLKQSIFNNSFFIGVTGRSVLDDATKEKYLGVFLGGITY
jgi:hypothetical protein